MIRSIVMLTGLVVAAAGCREPEVGVRLLMPPSEPVEFSPAWNTIDDGIGAFVSVEVMTYDARSGAPVPGAELQVASTWEGALILGVDELVEVDADACPWCEVLLDAPRRRLLTAEFDEADRVDEVRSTDAWGLARIDIFVEAFPVAAARAGEGASLGAEADDLEAFSVLVSATPPAEALPAASVAGTPALGSFLLAPR